MKPFDTLNRLPAMPQETVWLQARMETLSVRESLILGAALMGNPAYDARDVINIFQSMSDYEVCYPAGSYEALGRYALRYDAQLPQELSEHIDLEQLGRNYEDEHPGLFFGNCYVEYPNQGPALRYNGENLACCVDDGWSVKVKLASPRCPDGVWLRLPDYEDANDGGPDEMRITLDELGVKIVTNARCWRRGASCRDSAISQSSMTVRQTLSMMGRISALCWTSAVRDCTASRNCTPARWSTRVAPALPKRWTLPKI